MSTIYEWRSQTACSRSGVHTFWSQCYGAATEKFKHFWRCPVVYDVPQVGWYWEPRPGWFWAALFLSPKAQRASKWRILSVILVHLNFSLFFNNVMELMPGKQVVQWQPYLLPTLFLLFWRLPHGDWTNDSGDVGKWVQWQICYKKVHFNQGFFKFIEILLKSISYPCCQLFWSLITAFQ